ncbi:MAG: hypothetical protein CMP36_00830 [Rickettsiales bacterium]|nr:hypothetical protein [Rickettsiales bacterium]OUV82955.1 MAG: hypothetical protein CBC91_01210 [Rickettsiales bacterium TMED131]
MSPIKKIKKNNKVKKRSSNIKKKEVLSSVAKRKSNLVLKDILSICSIVFKAPFQIINLIINRLINLLKEMYVHTLVVIKNIFSSILNFKEAFFSIIFGLLSGSIGAVILFSYLEFNSDSKKTEYENKVKENTKIITENQDEIEKQEAILNEYNQLLNSLNSKLIEIKDITSENKENLSGFYKKVDELFLITKNTEDKLLLTEENNVSKLIELEKKIQNTSTIIMSSSKSELSNRIYLAQSLLDRLHSGVPYDPQLVALGKEGLHPALLRFAKGGAPTLSDLTARLTVRAGELRDAFKTKSDSSWKNNLKDEISKLVKIKPTNSANIAGMEGVLLRAEEAISRGDLEQAIFEIDSLDVKSRGVLNAWLSEAKARKNASIAAENLLAKTTAALRNKN